MLPSERFPVQGSGGIPARMSPSPETFCEAQRHRTPVLAARWAELVGMHLCNACYQKVHRATKGQGTSPEVLAGLREWLTEGGIDRARTVRLKGPPQLTPENAELLDRMAAERGMTQYGYMSDLIDLWCELRRAIESADSERADDARARLLAMTEVRARKGTRPAR